MSKIVSRFFENNAGNMTLRNAMLFGIAVMALSIVAAPALRDYSQQYAANNGYGIDRVMTGSISKPKRYVLQKSVLSPKSVLICSDGTKRDSC